jgi:hypothetical protein
MTAFLRAFHATGHTAQEPYEAAVVMPSILRPTIGAALRSVFAQEFPGRIQILIGVDHAGGGPTPDTSAVEEACRDIPPHCAVLVLYPGYSTSVRHGGLCPARDGGTLRTLLTHLANANAVAYLDDDNRWAPDHLFRLRHALNGHDYAFSLRWFVHHETLRPVAVDVWESVGPGAGVFNEWMGGFVDPNTLMIDRERCREAIVAWTTPLMGDQKAMSADRMVFARLRSMKGAGTGHATALYRLDPHDGLHPQRVRMMDGAYVP